MEPASIDQVKRRGERDLGNDGRSCSDEIDVTNTRKQTWEAVVCGSTLSCLPTMDQRSRQPTEQAAHFSQQTPVDEATMDLVQSCESSRGGLESRGFSYGFRREEWPGHDER